MTDHKRERDRERERQTDRQTDRDRETERQRQRERKGKNGRGSRNTLKNCPTQRLESQKITETSAENSGYKNGRPVIGIDRACTLT